MNPNPTEALIRSSILTDKPVWIAGSVTIRAEYEPGNLFRVDIFDHDKPLYRIEESGIVRAAFQLDKMLEKVMISKFN